MIEKKYFAVKHIRYEVESEAGKKVLIIPNATGVPDMKSVLCLSDTSLEIWDLITKGLSNVAIVNALFDTYHQEKTQLLDDVTEFITSLLEKEYITVVGEAANDD